MAADRRLISQDKRQRAAVAAIMRRASAKKRQRANDLVYRGGAKITNPVLRERDPAWAKEFRRAFNPNKTKRA